MSFSAKVKREVCRISEMSKDEAISVLAGIMKVSGYFISRFKKQISFKITTENPAIARLVFKLLKEHFGISY